MRPAFFLFRCLLQLCGPFLHFVSLRFGQPELRRKGLHKRMTAFDLCRVRLRRRPVRLTASSTIFVVATELSGNAPIAAPSATWA